MKLILLILAAWLVWRWSRAVLGRRPTSGKSARNADPRELSRQDISDADYEELP